MLLDTLIENANVVTLDPDRPSATRIGIWNGRIVGLDDEIDGIGAVEIHDLAGETVLPGFIDAHTHLQLTGQGLLAVDISAARSVDEALTLIAQGAAARPADKWLEVSGYDQRVLGRDLNAEELGRASGGRLVWARHISSHSSAVSQAVVDAIPNRSLRERPDIAAGFLSESDQDLVKAQRLPYSLGDAGRTVELAAEQARREGVTFCMDAGAGGRLGSLNHLDFATYLRLLESGRLPVRMQLMPSIDALRSVSGGTHDGFTRGLDLGISTGFGSDRLSVGALKVVLDGGMMVRTARLSEPYEGSTGRGVLADDLDFIRDGIQDAFAAGWQLAIHAIGDEAIDIAIGELERGAANQPHHRGRHRIEHGGLIRVDQIERLSALGVSIVSQPAFLYDNGDDFATQMGPRRSPWLYRGRSLLDNGIRIVGSTDRPLAGTPLQAIQTLVDRMSNSGQVIGDGEGISVSEAIDTFTRHGAWIAGMEDRLGQLKAGFLADATILGRSPFEVATDEISSIPVRGTIVDGDVVEVR